MEHRGVRYEIKRAIGKNQWVWIVHSSPRPRQGSIEGTRQAAILAAERTINIWWQRRHGRDAVRVAEFNRRPRNPSPRPWRESTYGAGSAWTVRPFGASSIAIPAGLRRKPSSRVGRPQKRGGHNCRPSSSGKPCCDSSHGARN